MGNKYMEDMVKSLNKLQDVSNNINGCFLRTKLPQIVVLGPQSVGKSGVIEGIVGKDIIPQGENIVTRCPLNLQLMTNEKEYFEFTSTGKTFTDPAQVKQEIMAETDRLAPKDTISTTPITLKYYSPSVLDLTLVDLPGLVRVAVGGHSKDIGEQIEKLVRDYVSNPNTLILAVVAANSDLATSDALRLALEVDPQRIRTIGVLTKLDIMDKGSNARDILLNEKFPLKYGYTAVKNRSKADIDNNVDIDVAVEEGEIWFTSHPSYSDLSHKLGTKYLRKFLNTILVDHIHAHIPGLKNMVETRLQSLKDDLEASSIGLCDDPKILTLKLYEVVQQFRKEFERSINAHESNMHAYVNTSISKGYYINLILNERLPKEIDAVGHNDDILGKELYYAILPGVKQNLFTSNSAFEGVVKKYIRKFVIPSHICVDLVETKIMEAISESLTKIKGYPILEERILLAVDKMVKKSSRESKDYLTHFTDTQCSYINFNHKDFQSIYEKLDNDTGIAKQIFGSAQVTQGKDKDKDKDKNKGSMIIYHPEVEDVGTIRSRMDVSNVPDVGPIPPGSEKPIKSLQIMFKGYIDVIKTTYRDYVPKLIYTSLVKRVIEYMESNLLVAIQFEGENKESDEKEIVDIKQVMAKDPEEEKRLKQLEDDCKIYTNALQVLTDVNIEMKNSKVPSEDETEFNYDNDN